jgi:hypothetical protein
MRPSAWYRLRALVADVLAVRRLGRQPIGVATRDVITGVNFYLTPQKQALLATYIRARNRLERRERLWWILTHLRILP